MEINARIYAIAESPDLLKQVHEVLEEQAGAGWFSCEEVEPCAVLPLTRTWYTYTDRAEPTRSAENWMSCLRKCGEILTTKGFVLVEFMSPDQPDTYHEYAYTTTGGSAGYSESRLAIRNIERAMGNHDISLVLHELEIGRSARDRLLASRRKEKKETDRRKNGDFEISGDGILVKYRGKDKKVIIPEGVREIGQSAFVDMKGVERMIVDDEEYDAPPMKTLVIPDGVEKIGDYAMAYCLNLVEAEMADSVRKMEDRAFEGCESLKRIRLSGSLTEIEENTFFLCNSLKSIEIPEGVTQIGEGAFLDCCELKKAVLPKSLEKIGPKAFYGCDELQTVKIPEGTEIAEDAFPEETELIRVRM